VRGAPNLAKMPRAIPLDWTGRGEVFVASQDRVKVHSSRLWALFNSFTRLLFPERMVSDDVGVSFKSVSYWYIPWEWTSEHLSYSHIAQVKQKAGFFWDTVIVESTGGVDPLVVQKVAKGSARDFVRYVRERLDKGGGPAPFSAQPNR